MLVSNSAHILNCIMINIDKISQKLRELTTGNLLNLELACARKYRIA